MEVVGVSARRAVAREAAELAGARVLRSFAGHRPTREILAAIGAGQAAGVTLFRTKNVGSPAQLRALTAALQAARPAGAPPILIGVEHEGGQLRADGDRAIGGRAIGARAIGARAIGAAATPWPGNLALAAVGSAKLALRMGVAHRRELAAMGINVDFASVSDPLADPRSPLMGTRTLGDDPATAGRLAAALVRGLQAAGVAATLRHFPGRGSVAGDSRHELPISDVDGVTLRACQTVPFATGIRAGVRLVMLGHRAAPADTDSRAVSAALAPELACLLLRDELGFEGVSVTDALDTGAYGSPENFPEIAVAAAAAGADLLLTVLPAALEDAAIEALAAALRDGRLDRSAARTAAHRIRGLRRWIGRSAPAPGLEVVGSSEHRSLAREIAERSVTLLRDRDRLLPLRVDPDTRVVVIAPLPTDLTPGDTSSRLRLRLADALRAGGLSIDELIMPIDPTPSDIAALRASLGDARCAIVGTIDALVHDGQARLVRALVDDGMRTVAVALRTPLDLVAYPAVSTAVATYGIQAPSVEALAAALLGRIPFRGRLPVRLDPELLGGGR